MPRLTGHIRVQENPAPPFGCASYYEALSVQGNPALTFDAPPFGCASVWMRLEILRLRLDAPPFGCAGYPCTLMCPIR